MLINIYSILCCASEILGKGGWWMVKYPTMHLTAAVQMYIRHEFAKQYLHTVN